MTGNASIQAWRAMTRDPRQGLVKHFLACKLLVMVLGLLDNVLAGRSHDPPG